MKVAIVLPFFYLGGVERWALNLQHALGDYSAEVEVFVLGHVALEAEDLIPGSPPLKRGWRAFLAYLVKHRSEPPLVITGLTKLNLLFALLNPFYPGDVITSVHLSLTPKAGEGPVKVLLRGFFHRLIVRLSTRVIAVSKGVAEELRRLSSGPGDRVIALYNPCFQASEIKVDRWPPRQKGGKVSLCSAGRLHVQKDFPTLLRAFALVPERVRSACHLTLYGEGEMRSELQGLIRELALEQSVSMPGMVLDLHARFQSSDLFVLSSAYEGFGNVLAEALSAGCRCVAFDIPHGPREILEDGRWGRLVTPRTPEAMAEALVAEIAACLGERGEFVSASDRDALASWLTQFSTEGFSHRVGQALRRD